MLENKEVKIISIEEIVPNRFQPRQIFGEKELNELANSIKEHGIIQPLILRKLGDKYEIIAGERRYKAAIIAGIYNVPAIVVEKDDNESAEIAIIENIQRKDLSPIEEAASYQKLLLRGLTQDDIARKLGISQPTVANKLRLLSLPSEVQAALLNNKISERHARALLRLENADRQVSLLNKIINEKLTVRQTDEEINTVLSSIFPESINIPEFKEESQIQSIPEIKSINDYNKIDTFEDLMEPIIIDPIEETKKEYIENEEIESFEDELNKDIEIPTIQNINIEQTSSNYLDAVDKTRDFVNNLALQGFKVTKEEYDMDKEYQFIIRIEK